MQQDNHQYNQQELQGYKPKIHLKLNQIEYDGQMPPEMVEQLVSQQQIKDHQLKIKQLEKQNEVDAVVVIFTGVCMFMLCYGAYLGVNQIRQILSPQVQSQIIQPDKPVYRV